LYLIVLLVLHALQKLLLFSVMVVILPFTETRLGSERTLETADTNNETWTFDLHKLKF